MTSNADRPVMHDCGVCDGAGELERIVGGSIEEGPIHRASKCPVCEGAGEVTCPEGCDYGMDPEDACEKCREMIEDDQNDAALARLEAREEARAYEADRMIDQRKDDKMTRDSEG